mgnify:CR=1 FL=1
MTDSSSGRTKEDQLVTGIINIPEVAHDTDPDDFVVCFHPQ